MPLTLGSHKETIFHFVYDGNYKKTVFLVVQPSPPAQQDGSLRLSCTEKKSSEMFSNFISKTMNDLISKESRSILAQLDFYGNAKFLNAHFSGEVLEKIHNLMFWGKERETESLKLEIEIYFRNIHMPGSPSHTLRLRDFQRNPNAPTFSYGQDGIALPSSFFRSFITPSCQRTAVVGPCAFSVTARILRTEGFVPVYHAEIDENINPQLSAIYGLMTRGKCADFQIVAMDGSIIPCCKLLLCAESKVLEIMLDTDGMYMEGKENRLELPDVSAEAAKGLVDFLQQRNRDAFFVPAVALELFQLADMYDIPSLLEYSTGVLVGKGHWWYDLETTLNLLAYSEMYTGKGSSDLKDKAISVFKKKRSKLNECPLCDLAYESEIWKKMFASED